VPLFLLPPSFKPSENVTYVGILVTAIVTVTGYISSRQAAQRLSAERERDEKHLRKDREEEHRRLQLDAAMRAGALFAPNADQPATPAAAASGLLALTGLGQVDLAVVLLVDLWSGEQATISTETAVLDDDPRVQGCVGTLIKSLIPRLENLGYTDFLQGNQKVMLHDLHTAADSATANPDGFLDRLVIGRAEQLAIWAGGCKGTDQSPGTLASAVQGSLAVPTAA
jgi:hypothetical protein